MLYREGLVSIIGWPGTKLTCGAAWTLAGGGAAGWLGAAAVCGGAWPWSAAGISSDAAIWTGDDAPGSPKLTASPGPGARLTGSAALRASASATRRLAISVESSLGSWLLSTWPPPLPPSETSDGALGSTVKLISASNPARPNSNVAILPKLTRQTPCRSGRPCHGAINASLNRWVNPPVRHAY